MNKKFNAGMKLENVNVLGVMRSIVDSHTKHYKTDFDYDIEILKGAAVKPERINRTFLWLCRESGTWLLRERDVFIRDTSENNTFRYYAEQTTKVILAYAVEATALNGNTVSGNIYGLDYKKHYEHVRAAAVPAGSVVLSYERGQRIEPPTAYFDAYPDKVFGKFERFEFMPESPENLKMLLQNEKQNRERFKEVSLFML